jgi:hypothetical protein
MGRRLCDSFDFSPKSAFRSLKSAILLFALLFAFCVPAHSQQPKKIARIGFLVDGTPSTHSTRIQAFRQGLQEAGYVEGKTIAIEYRYAAGAADRLSDLVPSWLVSKSMSSLQGVRERFWLPRKRPRRSPLFSLRLAIRWEVGLSRASRNQEQTSRDFRALLET